MKQLVEAIANTITDKEDRVFPPVGNGSYVLDQKGLRSAIRTGICRHEKNSPSVFMQVNPTEKLLQLSLGGLTPVSVKLTKKQIEALVQEYNIPTCS
jgi:hypothetical protein